MKFRILLIIIVFVSFSAMSSMQDSYNQAKQYQNNTRLEDPNQAGNKIIFDKNADTSNLTNMGNKELTNQGNRILNNSSEGQFLWQSELKKIDALKEYDLNPQNSLITNSMRIESEPLKHTEGSGFNTSEKVSKIKTTKSCTEGVEFEIDIIRQLSVETELVDEWGPWEDRSIDRWKVYYWWHWWWYPYFHAHTTQEIKEKIRARIADEIGASLEQIDLESIFPTREWDHYVIKYRYRKKTKGLKEKGEYWQVTSGESEKLAEENECHEVKRVCLDSETRTHFDQYQVHRPCWQEQITYSCTSTAKNDCGYLKTQGCQLEKSHCLKKMNNGVCLVWQRDYVCFTEKKELSSSLKGAKMFCLGGDCHTPTLRQNNDITDIAYLAALNEMKTDMQTGPIRVFAGKATNCKINILNFLNCCSSMQGWAINLGLSQCRSHEKALALQRAKGLCHFIGTYCSYKDPIFGICLTKKSTYCCFNSRLARIFQEQGREQLGMDFGSAEEPSCRGLRVEELQRIDFTKLDLGELFTDLINQAKSKMNKSFPKQLHNQMPKMQKNQSIKSRDSSY